MGRPSPRVALAVRAEEPVKRPARRATPLVAPACHLEPANGKFAVSVTIPVKLVSILNEREHWAKKAKRAAQHRWLAATHLQSASGCRLPDILPVVVAITRLAPRCLDGDNCLAACKAIRDGIADWLGVDDADARVTWRYFQMRSKAYGCRITVAPVEAKR